jgi:thiol-disulfide isomerase/thioredoxin
MKKLLLMWATTLVLLFGAAAPAQASWCPPCDAAASAVSWAAQQAAAAVSSAATFVAEKVTAAVNATVAFVVDSVAQKAFAVVSMTVEAAQAIAQAAVNAAQAVMRVVEVTVAKAFAPNTILGAIASTINNLTGGYLYNAVSTVVKIAQGLVDAIGIAFNLASNIVAQAMQLIAQLDFFGVEPGNYNLLQTITHFFWPASVDNPIRAAEQTLPYSMPIYNTGQVNRKLNFVWQQINVPKSLGAECVDGSDYKFFVNLTPASNNFLIYMEPGGACFDYESCSGKKAIRNNDGSYRFDANGNSIEVDAELKAFNPHGIADNYPSIIRTAIAGKVSIGGIESPTLSRLSLTSTQRVKMQGWNIIYMPYCSADVHAGDNTLVHNSVDGKRSIVIRHKGVNNVMATMGWLRSNLPRPAQVFLQGLSAGSAAVNLHRSVVRRVLNPSDSLYAMADSGFTFSEDPVNQNADLFAATELISKIRTNWWNFNPQNPTAKTPASLFKAVLPDFDPNNLNTLHQAASKKYPNDRMTYVFSQSDANFTAFGYHFNRNFLAAAVRDGDINTEVPKTYTSNLGRYMRQSAAQDLIRLKQSIADTNNKNVGYFMPSGRLLSSSHCMSALTYEGAVNADTGHSIFDVMNNLVDRRRPAVYREYESDGWRGLSAPLGPTTKTAVSLDGEHLILPSLY